MRGNAESMSNYGAKIQGAATGVPIGELPDFTEVRLRDGTMVRPRSVLTTTESGQGMISVVEKSIADTLVPERMDVTEGWLSQISALSSFIPLSAQQLDLHLLRQEGPGVEVALPDLDMGPQPSDHNLGSSPVPSEDTS